jgi:hypothetical protein
MADSTSAIHSVFWPSLRLPPASHGKRDTAGQARELRTISSSGRRWMTDTILLVLRAIIAQQETYIYIPTLGVYALRYIYIADPRLT